MDERTPRPNRIAARGPGGTRLPDALTNFRRFRDGLGKGTVLIRATLHRRPILREPMITPTVPTPIVNAPSPRRVTAEARVPRDSGPTRAGARQALMAKGVVSDAVWAGGAAAALVLIAGALTLATDQPWLFAALGPTAVTVASSPGHRTARFHSVVVGHASALAVAWLAVLLVGAGTAPVFGADGITVARVWASALAIAVTTVLQPSLRAYHPPAAATVLLVTLGAYRLTWKSSLSMLAGVLVVALVGEWIQRLRLREQTAANR